MVINSIYHGQHINSEKIAFIKTLIKANPDRSRWFLSRELCRRWNWRYSNGSLKDMTCRGLLLKLESEGLIRLPSKRRIINNPFINRQPPEVVTIDQSPIEWSIKNMPPIELRTVRRTKLEKLYNSLIHEHHYLGYKQPVGAHLKYIAFCKDRAIACIGWKSAAWSIGCRDRFIGWRDEIRKKNIHLIAYNTRFLVMPWVRVANLGSYLLGLNNRIISQDYQNLYKHPIYFLETFIDTERHKGTCYKAANWLYLGKTKGRGTKDRANKQNRSIKTMFGYPLHNNFRELLCH